MSVLDPPHAPLFSFGGPEGRILLWKPARRVIASHWSGFITEQVGREASDAMARMMGRDSGWYIFNNAYDLENYEKGVRIAVADFIKRLRPQIESVHALVRSKLVAMGVAVINMGIGGFLQAHSSRHKFQHALEAVLADDKTKGSHP